ncbi:MAG: DUF1287 domain-containing protein [Myxococcales bacterium]|nr:DUF1287 domain-containing protein [Myxococcales bacterium]
MSNGPVLGQRRRPRSSQRPKQLFVLALVIGGAYLWVTEIGQDLDGPQRSVTKPTRSLVIRPAGPKKVRLPSRGLREPEPMASFDPVARALLAAARDHVARGVVPTVGSVPDLNAVKGSGTDLLERALHQVNFPLRMAVLLHRYRDPKAYGLRNRPHASEGERRRALSGRNTSIFLSRFAKSLPTEWRIDAADSYLPGDLVVLTNKGKKQRRQMLAIVGERTDNRGVSLLYTLDPRDAKARSNRSLADYAVLHHYRLHRAEIDRIRAVLPLPAAPKERGTTL